MVDTWTQGDLPEWVQAKLDEKGKEPTDENLLKIALKAVESNWADDDDRDDYRYKNKSKKTTLTGANIVAALARTFVVAVLTDENSILPSDDIKGLKEFKDIYSERQNIFKGFCNNDINATNHLQFLIDICFTKTQINQKDNTLLTSQKINQLLDQYLNQINDIDQIDLKTITPTAKHILPSTILLAANIAYRKNLTTFNKESNMIYSTDTNKEYFNTDKFEKLLEQKFDKQNAIKSQ